MIRSQLKFLILTAPLAFLQPELASAQLCQLDSKQAIFWSPWIQDSLNDSFNYTSGFARSLAMSENTVIVGDSSEYPGGAAYIYTRDGTKWQLNDVLEPKDGQFDDLFGTSVAIDGSKVVIGAPHHGSGPVRHGAAYIFENIDGVWTQTAKLTDDSVNDVIEFEGLQDLPRRFGTAVAIDGDAIIIGAPEDNQVAFQAGAAYFYRSEKGNWTQESKYINANASATDRLGRNVDIDGARAAAAAIGDIVASTILFEDDGQNWNQTQQIQLPSGSWDNGYLTPPLNLHGDLLVLGSPLAGTAFSGRAYIYQHDGVAWGAPVELLPPKGESQEAFGWSVAISDTHVVVGAPFADIQYPGELAEDGGAAYLFERVGGQWGFRYAAIADFGWDNGELMNVMNRFGSSIDMESSRFVVGSPWLVQADEMPTSAWYDFEIAQPDCDDNGEPDYCAPDCNGTRVPDACEIANRASGDCNLNTVPDECEAGFSYQVDDGVAYVIWGWLPVDVIWLNQFHVTPGHQVVTHIAIAWSAFTPTDHPAKLALWSDPNNDGNPNDATLLTSVEVASTNDFGHNFGLNGGAPTMSTYAIAPTYVGPQGTSFFVGASASLTTETLIALSDENGPAGRSWRAVAALGQADINVLGDTENIGSFPHNFFIRALALDCNQNGTWDQCDIVSGFSADLNANGIPDECEAPCPADIAPPTGGNGAVDVDDLLAVINGWGACPKAPPEPCAADTNDDQLINVDDLLNIINSWGPCV